MAPLLGSVVCNMHSYKKSALLKKHQAALLSNNECVVDDEDDISALLNGHYQQTIDARNQTMIHMYHLIVIMICIYYLLNNICGIKHVFLWYTTTPTVCIAECLQPHTTYIRMQQLCMVQGTRSLYGFTNYD